MFNLKNSLWLGDESSLRTAMAAEDRAAALMASRPAPALPGAEDLPRLYSRKGNVGVVEIRGSLINTENWMTAALGMSTYPAIREAMVFAAQDESVDQILLDIESPGGAVSGVNDTANLVREVRGSKPVTAYSDGLIASAAYWIGSAAEKLIIGETAIVGSIGVIATLTSVHEALKKEGVEVKVVRAGKNKAPGHPAEPMSDKAVALVQERADAIYDVFTETVTKNRPGLKKDKKSEWAEGNEFIGQDSIDAGLADEISSFDKVLAQLSVDNTAGSNYIPARQNKRVVQMPRAALDPKLVALVESGVALNAEQQAQVDAASAAAAAEAAEAANAEAAAQAAADAAAVAAAAAAVEAAKVEAAKSEVCQYLQGQINALQTELATAKAAATAATAELATVKAPLDALTKIAANSVNTMLVALGGSALSSLDALSSTEIAAKHAAVLADFHKTFPTSAVAATASAEPKKKPLAVVQPIHGAQLAGIRNTIQGGK